MTATVPFLFGINSFDATTYLIFTVAAFFALCAAISYLIATNLEASRRDAAVRARLHEQFAALTATPGEATLRSDDEPEHQLQWPNDDAAPPPAAGNG
jgi:hypothetical protein